MSRLVIIGASGHGKVAADIARLTGWDSICFVDDNPELFGKAILGAPVIGSMRDAEPLLHDGADAFVAIGNGAIRKRIHASLLSQGVVPITLFHPSAIVGAGVSVGAGSLLAAGSVVNPDAAIGAGCIVNTGATVDHDCGIGDFCHISVGANIAGTVTIGNETWVGAGAVVSNNIEVSAGCMIGAGAVVIRNIDASGTYVGVPARAIEGAQR